MGQQVSCSELCFGYVPLLLAMDSTMVYFYKFSYLSILCNCILFFTTSFTSFNTYYRELLVISSFNIISSIFQIITMEFTSIVIHIFKLCLDLIPLMLSSSFLSREFKESPGSDSIFLIM